MAFKRVTTVALNNNAGAYTPIPVTMAQSRHMKIYEQLPAQGLQIQLWNRETQSFNAAVIIPAGRDFDVADLIAEGMGQGSSLGLPAQTNFFPDARGTTSRAADVPIQIRSATATITSINVEETQ